MTTWKSPCRIIRWDTGRRAAGPFLEMKIHEILNSAEKADAISSAVISVEFQGISEANSRFRGARQNNSDGFPSIRMKNFRRFPIYPNQTHRS